MIRQITPDVMLSANVAKGAAWIKRQGFTGILAALIVLMQYPLWLGEGGWLAVHLGANKLEAQEVLNQSLRERNEILLAEVGDLKQGREAIEERARSELGMIAPDEIFIRVLATPAVSEKTATPVAGKHNE
ncbi:MAG: cell division protein FtsB [Thiobacillaceae bacterium]